MERSSRLLAAVLPALLGLVAASSPPRLTAQWAEELTVSGVVRGTDALPVSGGRVSFIHAGTGRVVVTLTDTRGRYRARVPEGDYTLRIVAAGHVPFERSGVEVVTGAELRFDATLVSRPFALPRVVVIGEVLEGVPGATGVISTADLESRRPADIRDAIRAVPGVQVMDEDAFGLNLNIGIRGLDARRSARVLLLEDGAPIHLGPYSDPTAHYHPPVEALERIEVLKGSGQILHGPQTVGGVVNFVRRPPEPGVSLLLTGGDSRFFSGHLRAGMARGEQVAALDLIRKQGDGVREFQNHLVHDVGARARLSLGRAQTLALKGGVYTESSSFGEAGLRQEEFERNPFGNLFSHDVFDLTRWAGQAVHEVRFRPAIRLTTNAYVQRVERTSWRQANSSSDRFGLGSYAQRFNCRPAAAGIEECGNQGRPRHYFFAGVEPRLRADYRLGAALGELEAGTRLHIERVRRRQFTGDTPRARTGTLTRDNALDSEAIAGFLHNRLELGPWSVTPGVRIEAVRSLNRNRMDGSEMSDRYTEVLPGLGGTFSGLPGTTIFAGLHRGFAPPRPADVLSPEVGRELVRVDAEISRTAEIGLRSRILPATKLELTWFRIDFDNQVVEGGLAGSGQRFVNAGRTLHGGVELAATSNLAALFPAGHEPYVGAGLLHLATARFRSDRASTIDGQTSVRGNRLPFAPRNLLSATLGYRHRSGYDFRLDGKYVAEQFSDDLNTRSPSPDGQRGLIPDHTVLSATATRELERWGVSLFVSGTNLTDRVYIADRREGIMVGAPRRMRAGVRWGA
jgi:Fe(3+) dicitrate transport protein